MFGNSILKVARSKHNGQLVVKKTLGLGVYIQADGLTQSGGIVRNIWKSTVTQLPGEDYESALILGYGGGTLASILQSRYKRIDITGVDIDPVIVSLGREYLGARGDVVIADALEYIKMSCDKKKSWDLVFVDLYKGHDFPEKFETEEFLNAVRKVSGTAVFNRLYSGGRRKQAVLFGQKIEDMFSAVEWYYPEANVMFIAGS